MVKIWCNLIIAKRRTWVQCPLTLQEKVKEQLALMGYNVEGERVK